MIRKSKKLKIGIGIAIVFGIVGAVGALNGWFGGGGEIPSDTFTRGLVAYWSFDEGTGNTAYDASGNGNNGTLTNGPKWTKGKSGSALSFDGSNDYVDCGSDESLDITDEITIEAWVKAASFPASSYYNTLVNKRGNYAISLYASPGSSTATIRYIFCGVDSSWIETGVSVGLNEWAHISVVWDGNIEKVYLNGDEVYSRSASGSMSPTDEIMGIGGGWSGEYFNGLIDEVRIYNRALSAEEIRYHYNRGRPVAHWKFDEGSGGSIYDATDNNNDGVLHLGTSGNTATGSAWVAGKHGLALSFDGVDDYVEVPDDESLNITEGITVMA